MHLIAERGELYAHIYENTLLGLERDLFWNLQIDCENVAWEGEEWVCSLAIDWMTWPVRRWQDIAGMGQSHLRKPELVEASVYLLGAHHQVDLRTVQFDFEAADGLVCSIEGTARLALNEVDRSIKVAIRSSVVFAGIVVVRGNLSPKPDSPDAAGEMVAPFLALDGFRSPRLDGWRYLIEPDD